LFNLLDLSGQLDCLIEECCYLESPNVLSSERYYYHLIRIDGQICSIAPLLDYA
jgi:hypothetical protein